MKLEPVEDQSEIIFIKILKGTFAGAICGAIWSCVSLYLLNSTWTAFDSIVFYCFSGTIFGASYIALIITQEKFSKTFKKNSVRVNAIIGIVSGFLACFPSLRHNFKQLNYDVSMTTISGKEQICRNFQDSLTHQAGSLIIIGLVVGVITGIYMKLRQKNM